MSYPWALRIEGLVGVEESPYGTGSVDGLLHHGTLAVSAVGGSEDKFKTRTTILYTIASVDYSAVAEDGLEFSAADTITSYSKWGAWLLEIGVDGTKHTKSVGSNQGYDTEAEAVAALPAVTDSHVQYGAITIQSAAAASFTANTTHLHTPDVAAVHFIDGPLSVNVGGIRGVGRIWSAVAPEWAFPNLREETMSGSLVQVAPGLPKGRVVNLDYTVQLMGAGAAYKSTAPIVRPECDPLLIASGMAREHVDTGGSETVSYALADTGHGSALLWVYAGGKLFRIAGVRGTWTWAPTAGGLGQIRFQLQGILTSVLEAALASLSYDGAIPPPAVNMALTILPSGGSSWTPDVAGVEVTLGNEIVRLDDVSAADGIEEFAISATASKITFTPRVVALTTYPAYALAVLRTVHTIDMTLGSAQYNRVKLDVNLAYLEKDPGGAEDNGFAAWDVSYILRDCTLLFD